MSRQLSEGRETGSTARGLLRVSDTSFHEARTPAWGLEPLEPRLLLSGNATVSQLESQIDTFFAPNVLAYDFPIEPDAVNGWISVIAFSDLDQPNENVFFDIEGIVSGLLFTAASVPPGPLTAVFTLNNTDLALLAADGNLHIEFTPSSLVDDSISVQESLHIGLNYEIAATPIVLSPIVPLDLGVYQGSVQGALTAVGEAEGFSVELEAGQTLKFEVVPDVDLSLAIEVRDPAGARIYSATSSTPGDPTLRQAITATLDGPHTISVRSTAGSGVYSINTAVNQVIEDESIGGAANDDIASAQDLNGHFIDSGFGSQRVVVQGSSSIYAPVGPSGTGVVLTESFEGGVLPPDWATSSTGNGRVRVTSAFGAADGSFALLMDTTSASARNEAIWNVDLIPGRAAQLSFSYAEWNDEEASLPLNFGGSFNGDGVSISDDGLNWHTILNATNSASGVWQDISIDLAAQAEAAGMTLGTGFKIKFQQYDNSALAIDGRGYDNIVLDTTGFPSIPSPLPDTYSFSLTADQFASIRVDDPPGNQVAFNLLDAAGNILTSNGVSSASGNALLQDFKAPLGGDYFVRIEQGQGDYLLSVVRGGTPETEPNETPPNAQRIDRTGVVLGAVDSAVDTGHFQIPVVAGDVLMFQTLTPDDGAPGLNTLDPALTLLDPGDASVSTDDNSAPDGRNALLSHTANQSGIYTLVVSGSGTTGTFALSASGFTGTAVDPFEVITSSIIEGSLTSNPPTIIDLTLDGTALFASLNPSDLTLNGVEATFTQLAGGTNTYRFGLPNSGFVEGLNTISLAGGSIQNLQGDLIEPFTVQFTVDTIAPIIIESSVLVSDILPEGDVTITLKFSEPVNASQLGTGAHTKLDTTLTESFTAYDPLTNELTVTYAGLTEGVYVFTLDDAVSTSFIKDPAGNTLDGEVNPSTIIPSGNGIDGGDFRVTFFVDEDASQVTPVSLSPFGPSGSFAFNGTIADWAHFDGDQDRFTLDLAPGQIMSLQMSNGSNIRELALELLDPNGQVIATSSGGDGTRLESPEITVAGTYTILVRTLDLISISPLTLKSYTGQISLNWVREAEIHGLPSNDDTASAEDLNPALVPLETGVQQAVVQGEGEGLATSDVYKISLAAGDELSLSLAGTADPQAIQLLGPAGEPLANGGGPWKDAVGLISGFVAPATGDYFVRIAEVSGLYTLVATLGAGFSPEPISSFTEIDLGSSNATIGAIGTSSSDIDTYTFQANAGDNLTLWTTTPGSTLPNPPNTLDSFLELKGPDGFLVIESGSGGDGLNALLNHTATETGEYTVRVLSQNNTRGGYILHTAGRSAGASPFEVTVTTITNGKVLTAEPTQMTVHLSLPVRLDTVDAADLRVNGVPAVSVTATATTSLLFDLPTGLGEGTYDITIADGVLLSLAGHAIQPFAQQNFIDSIAPRVTSSSIQDGDTLVPGEVTLTIVFDEELNTSSLNELDVDLFGGGLNGQEILVDLFEYDPLTSTLTLGFQVEQEGDYGLTLFSNTSAFRDLAGNRLDGETPVWPIPTNVSGNGFAGGNFNLNFKVDNVGPVPIFTPTRVAPLGSFAMQSLNNFGIITDQFDTDTFSVSLQTGQSITVVLTTLFGGLNPTLTGPTGLIAEPAPGEPIVLRYTHAGPDDTIDLVIGADNMTEFDLDIYINTELESQLSQVTDPAGTAHDLTTLFIGGYAPGIDVANVLGTGQPITTITRLNRLYSQLNTTFNFVNMTTPTGDGTLTVTAKGDLGDPDEFITITGESVFSAEVFHTDGGENTFVTTELTIPLTDLQAMAANGTISFTVTPSAMVGNFGSSEVTLSLAYPGMPDPPVDAYAIDLNGNQTISVIVNDLDQGTGLFTVELVDAVTGTIVATGVTDGGFDGVIQALTAPTAGRYHIRIHTPGSEDYSLTVLRGAAFDIELNDAPGNDLPSLNDSNAVQGYLRNLGGERLFATGIFNQNNQVFELDPLTLQVINSFFVGGPDEFNISVGDLSFDGDNLYVSTSSLLGLIAVDPDTGAIRWTSPQVDSGLVSVRDAVTYRGQGVNLDFNSLTGNLELVFFDIPTGEVTRRVATEPLNVDGTPIAGAATRGSIFVGEFGQISEVDAETGQILNSFPVSTSFFGSMAFVAGRLYVSDARFRTTVVYDPDTGQVIQSLQFFQFSSQFTIETIGGDAVVPIQDQDRHALNLLAGERVTLSTITPFDNPSGQLMNTLDPAIRVFDPSGAEVGFDDNSAADGKNAELALTANLPGEYVVQVTAPSGTGEYVLRVNRTSSLLGDLTGDGFVGIEDLNLVLGNWNQTVPAGDHSRGDSSGDGFVGIEDLNTVLGNWNATLPDPVVQGDLTGDGFVGIEDLNLVLGNWNTDGSADTRSDPTGDGFVGIEDLNLVLGNWNAGSPPTSSELTLMLQQSTTQVPIDAATTEGNALVDPQSEIIPIDSTVSDADGPDKPRQFTRTSKPVTQSESIVDVITSAPQPNTSATHGTQTAVAAWSHHQDALRRSKLGENSIPWVLQREPEKTPLGLWDDLEYLQ